MEKMTISKTYMQSPQFWNEPHNKKMEEVTSKLIGQRDLLEDLSKTYSKDYFQRTDGTLKQIEKKGFFSFLSGPSYFEKEFISELNCDYRRIKSELADIARPIRMALRK